LREWQNLRITPEEVEAYFTPLNNIGLLLGEPSGGLVDVDLDCPMARKLAPYFLPPTGMIHGRDSTPASHWWYLCPELQQTIRLQDPEQRHALAEIRSTGGQTVVPPSIHPSGEPLRWETETLKPAQVDADTLTRALHTLGAACLLAVRWSEGTRHEMTLALSGALCRAGWTEEQALPFVEAIARATRDEELNDRLRAVRDTYKAIREGREATGLPTLIDLLGERVGEKLREWLGVEARAVVRLNGSHFDTLTPINRVSNCQTAPEDPKCPPLEAVDLAERQPAPMEWLIENLIPAHHATNLYGDSGVCKTYLGLAIARACITGEPFAGYPVHKRGNVLYLDLELDTEEHTRRWWAICTGAGDPHPPKGLYYVRLQTDLFTAWVDILRLVNELQPVLVIVDSFGKASGKPLDPDLAIKLYTYFDSLDCAVLVIDHSPKPTADMPLSELREYGTVYKRHYARSAFQLELMESAEGRVGVMMRHQKSNFGRTVPEIPLLFEFEVEDSTVLAVRLHTGAEAMQQQSELFGERGAILEYLREQGEATVKGIADSLNLEEHKARRGIKGLEKAGLVERVPDSYPHRYRLVGSATGQFDTLTPINRVSNCQSGSPSAPSPDGLPCASRAIEDPPAVLEGEALLQGILDTFGGRVLDPTESRHALLEWLDLSARVGELEPAEVDTVKQCLLLASGQGYPRLAFTYNGKIHTIEAGERAWLHALADMTGTPYCEQALHALRWFANDTQRKAQRAERTEQQHLFEA
jgi:DNA-binding transcriptional ArsR family regulator